MDDWTRESHFFFYDCGKAYIGSRAINGIQRKSGSAIRRFYHRDVDRYCMLTTWMRTAEFSILPDLMEVWVFQRYTWKKTFSHFN